MDFIELFLLGECYMDTLRDMIWFPDALTSGEDSFPFLLKYRYAAASLLLSILAFEETLHMLSFDTHNVLGFLSDLSRSQVRPCW